LISFQNMIVVVDRHAYIATHSHYHWYWYSLW